ELRLQAAPGDVWHGHHRCRAGYKIGDQAFGSFADGRTAGRLRSGRHQRGRPLALSAPTGGCRRNYRRGGSPPPGGGREPGAESGGGGGGSSGGGGWGVAAPWVLSRVAPARVV